VNILVLIPARSGSKGVPGKNLRRVGGISLVGRAARVGAQFLRAVGHPGTLLIDTDSPEIAAEAVRWGAEAPFLRPSTLAADDTAMLDNVLHAARRLADASRPHDVLVLLQPTSPLRTLDDLMACWQAYDPAIGSAVGVVTPGHAPEQALRLEGDALRWAFPELGPERRRQDLPVAFRPSGSVYVSSFESLERTRSFLVQGRTRGVVLPAEHCVDIDSHEDLALADALLAAASVPGVQLGASKIGHDQPCYVIAEAGVNHNGRVDLAHKLVDVAADSGAHAVKFQTFDPARLVSPRAAMAEYQVANTGNRRSQADMLRELVLPPEAHAELLAHAHERGIEFLSSPFDEQSADFLEQLGVAGFKLGSGELTNHPLIAHVARKQKPLLLSTGMADMPEIDAALAVAAAHGLADVVLFHCVTSYPAAAADLNLRAIASMRAAFRRPTGYSDHAQGIHASVAAVALGACVIEKHFTLDRTLPGPDHKASLEPDQLRALVQAIAETESALGDGFKQPRPVELPLRIAARKSLHALRDLPRGRVLAPGDLIALRPGSGIPPSRLDALLGRRLSAPIAAGELLDEAHLE